MSQESNLSSTLEALGAIDSLRIASNLRRFKDIGPKFADEQVIDFASKLADAVENHGGQLNKSDFGLIYNQVIVSFPKNVALKIMNEFKQNIRDVAFSESFAEEKKEAILSNLETIIDVIIEKNLKKIENRLSKFNKNSPDKAKVSFNDIKDYFIVALKRHIKQKANLSKIKPEQYKKEINIDQILNEAIFDYIQSAL